MVNRTQLFVSRSCHFLITFFLYFIFIPHALYSESDVVSANIRLQTDFYGAVIEEEDLSQGCDGPDCIPALFYPQSVGANQVQLKSEAMVLGVVLNDESKAYPIQILKWHEVVNDTIGDVPVLVTYTALTGTAKVYRRRVNGVQTTFGVSGKLYNSNLVMYDHYKGNLWQQLSGQALVGPAALRHETLRSLPVTVTTWGRWKKSHPQTRVLSDQTGYEKDYTEDPYPNYDKSYAIYFPVKHQNRVIHPKTVVYGIVIGEDKKAYPEYILDQKLEIKDEVGGRSITVSRDVSGQVFVKTETKKDIPVTRTFWFAWQAFYPDSKLQMK